MLGTKEFEFPELFQEFVSSGYLDTLDGLHHLEAYDSKLR